MIKNDITRQGNFLFRYRSFLPFLILPLAIYYFHLLALSHVIPEEWEHFFLFSGMGISFSGLCLRAFVVGYVPKNTSGRNTTEQKADYLNTTGMYSLVRHPLYFANYIMFAGFLTAFESISFFIIGTLVYFIYYERIAAAEENFLHNKYGDVYEKWSNNTPAFFPRFKGWIKPELGFSWKKIIRKEGPGFLLVFTYFFIFDLVEDVLLEGEGIEEIIETDIFLIIFALLGVAFYGSAKMVRKMTEFLDVDGR